MDKARYVERILEVENLTDELEDPQANWLLDWGIGQLDGILKGIVDEELAGEKVNALMAVMRKINRITGSRPKGDLEILAVDFATLADLFGRARGCQPAASPADCQSAAAHFAQLPVEEALVYMVEWCAAHCA